MKEIILDWWLLSAIKRGICTAYKVRMLLHMLWKQDVQPRFWDETLRSALDFAAFPCISTEVRLYLNRKILMTLISF